MATWLPIPSSYTGFAHRFVDPALGFALGMFLAASSFLGRHFTLLIFLQVGTIG
jgi:amino acid permease